MSSPQSHESRWWGMRERKAAILVVAAHPDDDILGCGASMAKWSKQGRSVTVVTVSDGVTARQSSPEDAAKRRAAGEAALVGLGVRRFHSHALPDNRLDTVPMLQLAQLVEDHLREVQPEIVVTHSLSDLNIDHRCVAEAVLTACRPQPGSQVRRLLSFEVPSSTGWMPGPAPFDPRYFVDVSTTLAAKLVSLQHYHDEMRDWPHARSYQGVEHLARWRGSSVGVEAAEAFEVARWLD